MHHFEKSIFAPFMTCDRGRFLKGTTILIAQGQSPYQILTNHPELDMSVRTLYNYLDEGILTARNIDRKHKVKFEPRKCNRSQITQRSVFQGRLYSNFLSLGLDHWTEMDTVHSSNDSPKILLTFFPQM